MHLLHNARELDCWCKVKITPTLKYIRSDFGNLSRRSSATVDCDKATIHVWYPINCCAKIQLLRDKDQIISATYKWITCTDMAFRYAPKCVFIEDTLHLIGCKKHYACDAAVDQWKYVSDDMFEGTFRGHGIAKIKDKVLAFGGQRRQWGPCHSDTNSVHEYDIAKRKWTTLPLEVSALQGMGCTPILDEKYILIIGGATHYHPVKESKFSGKIRIYSVVDQSIRTSKIECPKPFGPYDVISVRDKRKDSLTATGYMRKEWKECGIADHLFPPQYILNLIAAWYWSEYVHIFSANNHSGKGEHHKIDAFEIMSEEFRRTGYRQTNNSNISNVQINGTV